MQILVYFYIHMFEVVTCFIFLCVAYFSEVPKLGPLKPKGGAVRPQKLQLNLEEGMHFKVLKVLTITVDQTVKIKL